MKELERHLRGLLNTYCCENASDTPDYILSEYLMSCLDAFNVATQERDHFFRSDPTPLDTPKKENVRE